jgi:hypothetical protein
MKDKKKLKIGSPLMCWPDAIVDRSPGDRGNRNGGWEFDVKIGKKNVRTINKARMGYVAH